MDTLLSLKIEKNYQEFKIQAELEVGRGEFFSLIGPSGCGKTTLLRLIAGLELPDKGQILLEGNNITHLAPFKRRIGMVFQDYALFPHLNVVDNIGYGLKFKPFSIAQKRQKISELLSLLELDALAGREINLLSGGERQRVALARALAPEPSIILLDEPFSALDYGLRTRLRRDLKSLQQQLGFTAIFVTHQQEEALALSDRCGIMRDGRLLQVDTARDIYENPCHEFVASFLGDTNQLACRVERLPESLSISLTAGNHFLVPLQDGIVDGAYLLLIRPEDFRLTEAEGNLNPILEGKIIFLEYLGFAYRVEIVIPGGFLLKLLLGKENCNLKVGMAVTFSFNPKAVRFLPLTI